MDAKDLLVENATVLVIDPNQNRQHNAAKWIKEMLLRTFRYPCIILLSSSEDFDHSHLLSETVIVLHGESFTEDSRSELTATLCKTIEETRLHYISYETSQKVLMNSIDSVLPKTTIPGTKREHDDETSSETSDTSSSDAELINYTEKVCQNECAFPSLRFLTDVAKLVISYNSRSHTTFVLFASQVARNHFQLSMKSNRTWGQFSDLFGPATCPTVASKVLAATEQKHQTHGFYINLYTAQDRCPRSSYVMVASGTSEMVQEGVSLIEHLAVLHICSAGCVGSARLQYAEDTLYNDLCTPRSMISEESSLTEV